MVVMVLVVEMMMMMIMMKSNSMTVTIVMISPIREGISPADFSLPESFSLSGVFRLVEAAEYFHDGSPGLRFSGGRSTRRGSASGGPGWPHHLLAWLAWEPRREVPTPGSPFGLLHEITQK